MHVNVLSVLLSLARSQSALQRSSSFCISKAGCENMETWFTCPFYTSISSLKTSIYCLLMLLSHLFCLKSTTKGAVTERTEQRYWAAPKWAQCHWKLPLRPMEHLPRAQGSCARAQEAVLEMLDAFFLLCCCHWKSNLSGGWFQDSSAHVAWWVTEQPECETVGGSCSSTIFCSWQLSLCFTHFKTFLMTS